MTRSVGWMSRMGGGVALALGLGLAVAHPGALEAQTASAYVDFDALTSAVRGLERDLVQVSSLVTAEGDTSRLLVEQGVPGFGTVTASWIVTGSGQVTLTYTSQKGGTHTTTVPLG